MNLRNIARLEVRAVDSVITYDRILVELAYPIVFEVYAEILKSLGLCADSCEEFDESYRFRDFQRLVPVEYRPLRPHTSHCDSHKPPIFRVSWRVRLSSHARFF